MKKAQSKDICPTMKVLFVFALALAATQALDLETEWAAFKTKFEKNFLSVTHVSCKDILLFIKHKAKHF